MQVRKKLGETMLELGIINQDQLSTALEHGKLWRLKIGQSLLVNRFISELQLRSILSRHLGVPAVDLTDVKVTEAILKSVPKHLAVKYEVFPICFNRSSGRNVLQLAMADPMNLSAIAEVEFASTCKVEPSIASHSQILHMIRLHYLKLDKESIQLDSVRNGSFMDVEAVKRRQPLELDLAEPSHPNTPLPMAAPSMTISKPVTQPSAPRPETTHLQQEKILKALIKIMVRKNMITREELAKELEGL